jgi:hypothetical protein
MWVICGGMPRSGSTVQFQIAARIVESANAGTRVEWVNPNDFVRLREKYAGFHGMKVFKTHTLIDEIRREFDKNNAIGLYIYRDLRDVFVSSMVKESSDFSTVWKSGFLDRCTESFNAWTNLPGILVSRYEDVVLNLGTEVTHIANRLSIELSKEQVADIAEDYSIEKQKERMIRVKNMEKIFDESELLHSNHIASGNTGQWRERLSALQVFRIELKVGWWLRKYGYDLSDAGKLFIR